jgi:hypothetical protein
VDRGATWSKVGSFPLPGLGTPRPGAPTLTGLSFVIFDPTSGAPGRPSRTLLAASADPGPQHLFRSDDAGEHWRAVAGEPRADLLPVKADLDAKGVLYIAYANGAGPNGVTDGAVYKLDLKSGAWTDITPDKRPDRPYGGYMGISLDRQHPGTVMVATLNRWQPGDTIWRSTDGGSTWRSLRELSQQDVSATPFLRWGGARAEFGWWMAGLAIDPFDSDTAVYTTGATVYADHRLSDADRGGGLTWAPWVDGIEQTAVLNLTSPPARARLLSGFGDIGGFAHDDLGRSPATMFTAPVFNDTNNIDFAGLNPRVVVRSGVPHDDKDPSAPTLAYSDDGARTWRALSPPRPTAPAPVPEPGRPRKADPYRDAAVVVSADGSTVMVTTPTPVITRGKVGASWFKVTGLPLYARPVPDRADPSRFYALDFETGRLFVSHDGGATFSPPPTRGLPPDILADRPTWREAAWPLKSTPGRPGDLWFVSRQGLYRSTNGGLTFAWVPGDVQVEMLDFGKAPPGRDYPALFAIGRRGGLRAVWRSDDQGASWIRINDDQHEYGRRFRCIAGDPRVFGRVYVGTDGRGILYADPALSRDAP